MHSPFSEPVETASQPPLSCRVTSHGRGVAFRRLSCTRLAVPQQARSLARRRTLDSQDAKTDVDVLFLCLFLIIRGNFFVGVVNSARRRGCHRRRRRSRRRSKYRRAPFGLFSSCSYGPSASNQHPQQKAICTHEMPSSRIHRSILS